MATNLGTAYVEIVPSTKGLGKSIAREFNAADKFTAKAGQGMGQKLKSGLVTAAKGAGLAVAAVIGASLAKGWGRLTAIENAQAKLKGLGHDAGSVEKIMGNALASVKGTAFGLDTAATAAAGAVAAGIKPGAELEGVLKSMANSAAAAGVGMDEMGAIYNRVASQGKAQNDSLQQVAGKGIPIYQALADQLGVTTDEVFKMASAGKISFADFEKAMTTASGTVADEMGKTTTGALSNLWAALGRFGAGILGGVFPHIAPIFASLTEKVDALAEKVGPLADVVGQKLGQAFQFLVDTFDTWAPILAVVVGALATYWAVQKAVMIGTAIWNGLMLAQKIATAGAAVQMRLLNGAMRANPIGFVITLIALLVAGFILAYKKIGWFRDGVNAAWAGIKIAISAVVEWVKTYVWPALVAVWDGISAGALWLWQNAIKPAWDGIRFAIGVVVDWFQANVLPAFQTANTQLGGFFTWLYQNVVKPVFTGIKMYIQVWWTVTKAIFSAVVWFVKNILAPVFNVLWQVVKIAFQGIRAVIQVAWAIIKGIFSAIVGFVKNVLAPVFTWLWNNVMKPVWNGIKSLIQTWWSGVKIIFNAVVSFLKTVFGPAFRWLYNNIIKPVWNGIKNTISGVWTFIRDKVFNPMKNAVTKTLPDAFRRGKDAIGKAWDGLKDKAKQPVRFVVDTIINKGVIGGFNKIASKFGAKEIDTFKLPKGFRVGGWTGPGSKYQPAGVVHADEYVLRKEAQRKITRRMGRGFLDHMNRTGEVPGYAKGGRVKGGTLIDAANWWIRKGARGSRHPAFGGAVRSGHSRNSLHYQDRAVDLNYGPGGQNATEMAFFDRHVAEFKKLFPGIRVIWRAPGHYNHMHIDTSNGADIGNFSGAASGGGIDISTFLNPFKKLFGKVKAGVGSSAFGDVIGAGAKKIIEMPIQWIKDNAFKVADLVEDTIDNIRETAHHATVKTVAATYGWGFGPQWDAINWLVQKESGWNPNAKNPRSSARGLFQKMTCLVTDAEILTREGWKRHDEVQPGDETLGYNPETGRNEWTMVKRVVHYDNAPIVHMRNGRVAYRSTPNHRWLTEQRYAVGTERMVETQDLNVGHRLIVSAPAATSAELDITTAEAALVGWLLADGTLRMPGLPDGLDGREPVGHLYQSKPEMVSVIEALLNETVGDYGHSEREPRGKSKLTQHVWRMRASDVRSLALRARLEDGLEMFVTRLSMEQREAFLTAVKQAEGTPVTYGETELWRIPQLDGPKQDAFIMAAYLSGHKPLVNAVDVSRSEFKAQPLSQVTLASPTVGVQSLTFETDADLHDVWCVETELGTWTARDLGQVFLTGNSIHGPIERTVLGQARWGLRYIKDTYGTPTNAMRIHKKQGWYADGGHVKPLLFDRGGTLMPGTHLVANKTGKPEYILPAHVTDALINNRGDRGGDTFVFNGPDPVEAMREYELLRKRREALALI